MIGNSINFKTQLYFVFSKHENYSSESNYNGGQYCKSKVSKNVFLHEDVRSTIATIANGRYMTGKTDDASIGRIGIVGLL